MDYNNLNVVDKQRHNDEISDASWKDGNKHQPTTENVEKRLKLRAIIILP